VSSSIWSSRAIKRRSFFYRCGIILLTLRSSAILVDEARHQLGELQEVGNPDQRAPPTNDDLRIGCDDLGPLPRHRANVIVVYA